LKFDLGLFKVHLCINAAIVDSYDVHLYVLFYTYCFRLGLVTVLQRAGVFNVYLTRIYLKARANARYVNVDVDKYILPCTMC
jgi:hypothetical protein